MENSGLEITKVGTSITQATFYEKCCLSKKS